MQTLKRAIRDMVSSTLLERGIFFDGGLSDVIAENVLEIIKRRKEKPVVAHGENFFAAAQALAKVCKMDFQRNQKRLFREAKAIGMTAEEILRYYGDGGWWYTNDWRGRVGHPPSTSTIRETWGRWMFAQPTVRVEGQSSRSLPEGV